MRKPKDPLQPERCAEVLAALAAPERLRIVRLLADGPRNVTQIIDGADIKDLNVSHHLTVLKHANLVRAEKRGRFVFYSLAPNVLDEVIEAGVPKDALDLGCCRLVLPPESKPDARAGGEPPSPKVVRPSLARRANRSCEPRPCPPCLSGSTETLWRGSRLQSGRNGFDSRRCFFARHSSFFAFSLMRQPAACRGSGVVRGDSLVREENSFRRRNSDGGLPRVRSAHSYQPHGRPVYSTRLQRVNTTNMAALYSPVSATDTTSQNPLGWLPSACNCRGSFSHAAVAIDQYHSAQTVAARPPRTDTI